MKNRKIWFGFLVMVLVFGLVVVGCGGDSSSSSILTLNELNLVTETPSSSVLTSLGISEGEFNSIISAAGGGYQGYLDRGFYLLIFWTGRVTSDFHSLADVLDGLFGEDTRDSYMYEAMGGTPLPYKYRLNFYTQSGWTHGYWDDPPLEFTTPAGTMLLELNP